jgi:hypothetical protein
LLLCVPTLCFTAKDITATIVILATEPGITARASFYYSIALLPGTLFVSNGNAFFVNILFGAFLGGLLYLLETRRKRHQTESRQH